MKNLQKKHAHQGRPRVEDGVDRYAHILDNALSLFATQGIAGTTIAQIAQKSDVTPAMIHYYFKNREGLLDSFVTERLAPAVQYVWSGVSEDILTDPEQIVTAFVERLLDTVEKMPQLPLLWSREILNAGGLLRERLLSIIPQKKIEIAQKSFRTAQQKGRLNTQIAPNLIFTSIMAVVMLPLATQKLFDKIPSIRLPDKEILRQHALALLLNGLFTKKNQESVYEIN